MTKLRKRVPWFSIAGILLAISFTLGDAAATIFAGRPPSADERRRAEQDTIVQARRTRIVMLQFGGDRCRAPIARELARALAFDGQFANEYADDYERRCGEDPIVRKWGDASIKLRLRAQRTKTSPPPAPRGFSPGDAGLGVQ